MTTGRDERTLPLTVANTGFLLERLGQDCHPLQFLRELTQNSIEAITRADETDGQIVWDVDWHTYDLGDEPVYKLCVTDNGDGMTGPEMVEYINRLSSSLSEQSFTGNYGVGAKIAAATRNHAGLIYMSWKNGIGSVVHLWRDPQSGQYGLRQMERPDGSFGHWAKLEDDVKPTIIDSHGTKVILCGNSDAQDTMRAPEGAASPSRWIAKYINTRYFEVPRNVTIRAREGWENPRSDKDRNLLRTIIGQKEYLERHNNTSGRVALNGATAHWWILKDEPSLTQNSGWIESSGHVAALYQGELYELSTSRAGRALLQSFGVLFGHNRVVIYIEPHQSENRSVTTNTARTHLLLDGQQFPWEDFAWEFGSKIPHAIRDLMEEVAAGSEASDHTKSIRERLKAIMDLYRVSRYRPTLTGKIEVDVDRTVRGGSPSERREPQSRTGGRTSGTEGGTAGGIYSAFLKKDGTPASDVNADLFPNVRWISVEDGTREPGDIEDRAARYVSEQNALLINADFRVFIDMIEYWHRQFGRRAEVLSVVIDAVRSWFEQELVETVLGVKALEASKEWSSNDIKAALSEEALTAAVMPRYHVNNSIKRELGTKLGRLKAA